MVDYASPVTSVQTPGLTATDALQLYFGIAFSSAAAALYEAPVDTLVRINLTESSDGTSRQLLVFEVENNAVGAIASQRVTISTARSGIASAFLVLGLKSATPSPLPVPGDAGYRDHVAEMLARLPERYRRKRIA